MNRRSLIIVGILLGVALLFFLLSKVLFKKPVVAPVTTTQTQTQDQKTTTTDTTTTTTSSFPLEATTIEMLNNQAKSEFDFAFGKAKEWRADATPMAVLIKYTGGIDITKGKDTYIFFAPSQDFYYYTVTVDQAKNSSGENNFERVIYYREDYFLPKDIVALPIKYWTKSYLDALQKADSLGGKDIRASNAKYDVTLVLSAQEGKFIQWNTEYLLDGKKMFSVQLSANTGEEMTQ